MSIAAQLRDEIESRLAVVALLDSKLAHQCITEAKQAPTIWAQILAWDESAARTAPELVAALHPDGPPVEWWATPIGRRLIDVGHQPAVEVSGRAAARLLGWSRYRVEQELGAPPIPVVAVVAALNHTPETGPPDTDPDTDVGGG